MMNNMTPTSMKTIVMIKMKMTMRTMITMVITDDEVEDDSEDDNTEEEELWLR